MIIMSINASMNANGEELHQSGEFTPETVTPVFLRC